jgi:hypothetical protein
MSDIADKIYAATGLTLGAEAAAAIGRLIQVENEKLRAKADSIYSERNRLLLEENGLLRQALADAWQCIDADDVIGAHAIIVAVLGEKQ